MEKINKSPLNPLKKYVLKIKDEKSYKEKF